MKIAFISYEFPPDTAFGGIATYVYQAAKMLHQRNHYVEVFAGSHHRSCTENVEGFLVHRILEKDLWEFYKPAGKVFAKRHSEINFDVLEGPEFAADAREAINFVPEIPLVIKLHTPSIVLFRLNDSISRSQSLFKNLQNYIRAGFEGLKPEWGYSSSFLRYKRHTKKINEIEKSHASYADEIASPSKALGRLLVDEWKLNPDLISHVPYPYHPSEQLLNIPADTNTNVITFLGRLEVRKGVLDLAKSIPEIINLYPEIKFRFAGSSDESPETGISMEMFLKKELKGYEKSVEFLGAVPPENIYKILGSTDICIFPSVWENFPLVCLESMAAARGIVAGNAGGMSDMIDENKSGILITPRDAKNIVNSLTYLIKNRDKRIKFGIEARNQLLKKYNINKIGALQEESYKKAIIRRRKKGSRLPQDKGIQ